ncbi:MAG: signal peptidase I [Planctomycetota bacterium]
MKLPEREKKYYLFPLGELNNIPPFSWLHFELIDTLAVAFIIAMFVKVFLFEIYKVPTSSMEPTILGDMIKDGQFFWGGDRVLVSKIAHLLGGIKRFDPVGFHHPLQKNIVFVKRVVGLPEEDITVIDGEVFYRKHDDPKGIFKIAKKPLKLQESIWIPVNIDIGGVPIINYFESKNMVYELNSDTFKINLPQASLHLTKSIKDKFYLDSGGNPVRDIKLFMQVQPSKLSGKCIIIYSFARFKIAVRADFAKSTVHLIVKEKNSIIYKKATNIKISEYYPISFALLVFDGDIILKVDQKVALQYTFIDKITIRLEYGSNGLKYREEDFDKVFLRLFPYKSKLKVLFDDFEGYISKLKLFRDIFYIDKGGVKYRNVLRVPPKKYFVMGDHSTNSYDSREWRKLGFSIENKEYYLDSLFKDSKYSETYNYIFFKDEYGIPRYVLKRGCRMLSRLEMLLNIIKNSEERNPFLPSLSCSPESGGRRNYFVDEELIMGKPLMILFPWSPKFRVKIIR